MRCVKGGQLPHTTSRQLPPTPTHFRPLFPSQGGCEIGSEYGGVIGAQFKDVISFADTSRPITANSEWKTGSTDTLTNIMDVMTCSYTYETYTEYHLTHPWKVRGGVGDGLAARTSTTPPPLPPPSAHHGW